jgi:GTP cyclohydrolase I
MLANDNKVLTLEEKNEMKKNVEILFRQILREFNFDVDIDQQIKDTPKRWTKMMVDELLSGCYTEEPKLTVFKNTKGCDSMIFIGPIQIKSLCSHHLKSFIGEAYLGYIADENLCGISKLSRIVNWFMRRPQIQEELTKQIADYIENKLNPKGCGVFITAQHLCMSVRGVNEYNSKMKTSELRGCFRNPEVREEFFNLIKLNK